MMPRWGEKPEPRNPKQRPIKRQQHGISKPSNALDIWERKESPYAVSRGILSLGELLIAPTGHQVKAQGSALGIERNIFSSPEGAKLFTCKRLRRIDLRHLAKGWLTTSGIFSRALRLVVLLTCCETEDLVIRNVARISQLLIDLGQ